jgi:hypothetical protein
MGDGPTQGRVTGAGARPTQQPGPAPLIALDFALTCLSSFRNAGAEEGSPSRTPHPGAPRRKSGYAAANAAEQPRDTGTSPVSKTVVGGRWPRPRRGTAAANESRRAVSPRPWASPAIVERAAREWRGNWPHIEPRETSEGSAGHSRARASSERGPGPASIATPQRPR